MSIQFMRAAAVAVAIAMPATGAVPQAARSQPWTGCYIGVHGGYEWGSNRTTEPGNPFYVNPSGDGAAGGAFAGCYFQPSSLVWGIEADFARGGMDGRFTFSSNEGTLFEKHWDASLRLKLGVSVERALIYATGGIAYAKFTHGYFDPVTTETQLDRQVGWTVGAGIARQLSPNWIAHFEYRFSDFSGTNNFSTLYNVTYREEPQFHTVRFGIGYLFSTK